MRPYSFGILTPTTLDNGTTTAAVTTVVPPTPAQRATVEIVEGRWNPYSGTTAPAALGTRQVRYRYIGTDRDAYINMLRTQVGKQGTFLALDDDDNAYTQLAVLTTFAEQPSFDEIDNHHAMITLTLEEVTALAEV
jgi:hypothetical protein